jgi:glycosyltransferase 2 family protein
MIPKSPEDNLAKGAVPSSWTTVLRWLGTILTLVLLVVVLSQQGWAAFWDALKQIPLWVFAAAVLIMLASRLAVSARWYVLLRSAGIAVSFGQCTRLVFAGLFASNFLPTTVGGDVARLAGALQLRLDAATTTASLVMDRLVGMAGMASLLPVGLPYVINSLNKGSFQPTGLLLSLAAAPAAGRLRSVWLRTMTFLQSLWQVFALWLRHPWSLIAALLWTYGHMVCIFTTVWILFWSMGQSVSWWTIGGLWVLNYFITLLPISINGLGVQEMAITYIYSSYAGVSMQAGLAVAVLIRLLYLLASLPGAAFIPGILAHRPAAGSRKI